MAHEQQRAGERRQLLLQPGDAVDVEVVGGLVEEQYVGPGHEDPGQGGPHPPPARQLRERAHPVGVGEPQPGQDPVGLGLDGVPAPLLEGRLGVAELPQKPVMLGAAGGGDTVLELLDAPGQVNDTAGAPQRLVERRTVGRLGAVLGQVGQRQGGRAGHGAAVGPLLAGQDLQQGRLARAVAADEGHAPPRAERDGHVGEQDALAVRLGETGTGEHAVRLEAAPTGGPTRSCRWSRTRTPGLSTRARSVSSQACAPSETRRPLIVGRSHRKDRQWFESAHLGVLRQRTLTEASWEIPGGGQRR